MSEQDISKLIDKMRNSIKRDLRESGQDIRLDALYQQLLFEHVFKRPEPLAAMTSWSVAPEFSWWLYQQLITKQPKKIIELGSGTSTLTIAAALKKNKTGRFLSFEHNHSYFEKTQRLLEECELTEYVDLIYAPLEEVVLENESYRWYSLPYDLIDHMVGKGELDILLIDGPPAATNKQARYPALPMLRKYCNEETVILLDDAAREEEKEILDRWIKLMGGGYRSQLLTNIRHGPALFYPEQRNNHGIAYESGISNTMNNNIIESFFSKKIFKDLSESQVRELKAGLLDSFYREREISNQDLKQKYEYLEQQYHELQSLYNEQLTEATSKKSELEAELLRRTELASRDLEERTTAYELKLTEATTKLSEFELELQRHIERSAKDLEEQTAAYELKLTEATSVRIELETEFLRRKEFAENSWATQSQEYEAQLAKAASVQSALERELNECKAEMSKLGADYTVICKRYKLVYKSLVYQIGLTIYNLTRSPKKWVKIPFGLRRVRKRHIERGNPDLVEYQEPNYSYHKNSLIKIEKTEKFNLDACSEHLKKLIKNINSKSVLWVASQIVAEQGHEAALEFADKNAHESQRHGVNLFRANANLNSDEKWLQYFNNYIVAMGLEPLSLLPGEENRFSRLTVSKCLPKVDGPLITVIMPAYNAEATIRHAVDSILSQTWRNIELIIVDDCSGDSTWNILVELAREDERIKILRNVENVGPYVSKNLALRAATGEYVTGQDADDWSHPQRLERDVKYLLSSRGETEATLSYMVRLNEKGEFCNFARIGPFSKDGVRRIASISLMIETSYLRDVLGGWDSVRFGADSEMIARAEKIIGTKFKRIDNLGMFCLDLETSLTNHPEHGVSKVNGISPTRKEFRDSYLNWHRHIDESNCLIPFPHEKRLYTAPEAMMVPVDYVYKNIKAHERY